MSVTVLYGERATDAANARSEGEHLWLAPSDFAAATGWKLESEGLCRGDACVRVESAWRGADGALDLAAFARHMGQPAIRDEASGAWAFGESVSTRREQMFSLAAPDFTLPDLDGKLHSLSDYRGKKVFIHSWGSY